MSRDIKKHLTDDEFTALVMGEESDQSDGVQQHLESCPTCGERVDMYYATDDFPATQWAARRKAFVARLGKRVLGSQPQVATTTVPTTEQILKWLNDKSGQVRLKGLESIKLLGEAAATPKILNSLRNLLGDLNWGVQLRAAETLQRLGAAVPGSFSMAPAFALQPISPRFHFAGIPKFASGKQEPVPLETTAGTRVGWLEEEGNGNLNVGFQVADIGLEGAVVQLTLGELRRFVVLYRLSDSIVGAITSLTGEERKTLPPDVTAHLEPIIPEQFGPLDAQDWLLSYERAGTPALQKAMIALIERLKGSAPAEGTSLQGFLRLVELRPTSVGKTENR